MSALSQSLADALVSAGTDLNDERACILDLMSAGYRAGQIVGGIDEAIEIARKRTMPSAAGLVGDAVALALLAATWIAAYCVVCPPGNV
jgi:hypothetical protein